MLAALPAANCPAVGDYSAMSAAGREALDDARATVLAVLSRAYQLVPAAGQRTLGRLRLSVSQAMPPRPEPTPADTVARVLGAPPPHGAAARPGRGHPASQTASRGAGDARREHGRTAAPGCRGGTWPRCCSGCAACCPDLDATTRWRRPATGHGRGDLPADTGGYVTDLLRYLTGPAGGDWVDTVAVRLFDLHVARYVMQPDGLLADQALELIQMSADTRTSLDPRTLAAEKLTGLQLHHFGAFCKASWRANDWMWGRLDGAGWLVHTLLDPQRLYQLVTGAGDPDAFRAELRGTLERIAGSPAPPGVWTPFPARDGHPPAPAELDFLTATQPPPPPVSLPVTAIWVASGLQRIIAGEELAYVAEQVGVDAAQGGDEGPARAFLAAYRAAAGTGQPAPGQPPPRQPAPRQPALRGPTGIPRCPTTRRPRCCTPAGSRPRRSPPRWAASCSPRP